MSTTTTTSKTRPGAGVFRTVPDIPCSDECLLRAGNTNCGGCGMSVGLTMLGRALEEAGDTATLAIPACCGAVTAGAFPTTSYGVPTVCTTFASAAAVASGLASIRDINGEDGQVICWAGDGGTYDIGLATLSAAAERGEDLLFVCYDNEIYGNTGGQRSSATPRGASTTTTRGGKDVAKKDILAIMAAHRIPYAATVSLAHPEDALAKLRHAVDLRGFRFLHLLAPCPTGWKSEPAQGIELVRLAVASGLYPVCQVEGGERWTIDVEPTFRREVLERYFALQGRFRHGVDLDRLEVDITRHWRWLRALVAAGERLAGVSTSAQTR